MIVLLIMFILLLLGVPIGVAMGLGVASGLVFTQITAPAYIAQSLYAGLNSFPLLALPFFMIAGTIMNVGGLSRQLVKVANAMIGNVTGGLGAVAILACMFFGAISGSAPATVAAIGSVMLPQMVQAGYDKYYAVGLVAVAGGLGVIVPPSFPLVLYGVTNNVSIGALFIAGIGPAIVVGSVLMLFNYIISKRRGYQGSGEEASIKQFFKTAWEAKWALLMPVIILGGIYGGIFTPTEAAVASVVYGLIVAAFVYKELNISKIWGIYKDTTSFLGGMMLTFVPAISMGTLFALMGVPEQINAFFLGISTNYYVLLFVFFLVMLVIGMFVETAPTIIILSPIFLNLFKDLGINPVHFGVVITISLAIAFVTPPAAVNLFVASTLSGISVEKIARKALPFVMALFVSLILIGFIPGISLKLLDILGMAY
ncbi:MAG: TRAP transporter large permease [Peptococcaceae bacterium]